MDITGIRKIEEEVSGPFPYRLLRYAVSSNDADHLPDAAVGNALIIDSFSYDEVLGMAGASREDRTAFLDGPDLALQCGGWQSWSAGWELVGRESLPRRVRVVSELIKFTNRDGDHVWRLPVEMTTEFARPEIVH